MTKAEQLRERLNYRLGVLFDVRDRDDTGNALAQLAKLTWLEEEIDKVRTAADALSHILEAAQNA